MTSPPLPPQPSSLPLHLCPPLHRSHRSSYASVLSGNTNSTSVVNNSNNPLQSPGLTLTSSPPHLPYCYHNGRLDAAAMQQANSSSRTPAETVPAYSRKFARLPQYDEVLHGDSSNVMMMDTSDDNRILTPSYLRNSRYIARLEAANRAKDSWNNPPRSHHQHRMAASHRGMTYDIVEKVRPTGSSHNNHDDDDDDGPSSPSSSSSSPMPLPSCWSNIKRHPGLDLSSGGLEAKYKGPVNKNDQDAASVRTDYPMPPQCGLYYYEITILAKPKEGYCLSTHTHSLSIGRLFVLIYLFIILIG